MSIETDNIKNKIYCEEIMTLSTTIKIDNDAVAILKRIRARIQAAGIGADYSDTIRFMNQHLKANVNIYQDGASK